MIPQLVMWWAGRSVRERVLISLLGLLVASSLVFLLAVRPLQKMRATALQEIRTFDTLNARLMAAGPALRRDAARHAGATAEIVQTSAPRFALPIGQVTPDAGGVRLVMIDAPFDALIRWLAELQRSSSLEVAQLAMQRGSAPGLVNVQLRLAR